MPSSEYPEYHTSLDNLSFISPEGLFGGYNTLLHCLKVIEQNEVLRTKVLCEPHLSKYSLYPTLGGKKNSENIRLIMDLLTYSDGKQDLLWVANKLEIPIFEINEIVRILKDKNLLESITLN